MELGRFERIFDDQTKYKTSCTVEILDENNPFGVEFLIKVNIEFVDTNESFNFVHKLLCQKENVKQLEDTEDSKNLFFRSLTYLYDPDVNDDESFGHNLFYLLKNVDFCNMTLTGKEVGHFFSALVQNDLCLWEAIDKEKVFKSFLVNKEKIANDN